MFRVVDIGEQIEELGLVKEVAPHLRKGGRFICSGGRFPEDPGENFFDPLELIRKVSLSNWSDGYPFSQNMGVVLRRR